MSNYDIDIVVTWVDGNEPKWQEDRNKHIPKSELLNISTYEK